MSSRHTDHMWSWTVWVLRRLRAWQCMRVFILLYFTKWWEIQPWDDKMVRWKFKELSFIHSTTFFEHQLLFYQRNLHFTQWFITIFNCNNSSIREMDSSQRTQNKQYTQNDDRWRGRQRKSLRLTNVISRKQLNSLGLCALWNEGGLVTWQAPSHSPALRITQRLLWILPPIPA